MADAVCAALNADAGILLVAARGGAGFVNIAVGAALLAEHVAAAAAVPATAATTVVAAVAAPPPRPPPVPHTLVVDMVPSAFDETSFELYKKYQARRLAHAYVIVFVRA